MTLSSSSDSPVKKLRKIKEASKRLDFITRAIREKERPILNQRNEEQSQTEKAIFDQNWELKLEEMRNAHGDKVVLKKKVEHIRGQSLAACLNDAPVVVFCALFSTTLLCLVRPLVSHRA